MLICFFCKSDNVARLCGVEAAKSKIVIPRNKRLLPNSVYFGVKVSSLPFNCWWENVGSMEKKVAQPALNRFSQRQLFDMLSDNDRPAMTDVISDSFPVFYRNRRSKVTLLYR